MSTHGSSMEGRIGRNAAWIADELQSAGAERLRMPSRRGSKEPGDLSYDLEGQIGPRHIRVHIATPGIPLKLAVTRAAGRAKISRTGLAVGGLLILVVELFDDSESPAFSRLAYELASRQGEPVKANKALTSIGRQAIQKGGFDALLFFDKTQSSRRVLAAFSDRGSIRISAHPSTLAALREVTKEVDRRDRERHEKVEAVLAEHGNRLIRPPQAAPDDSTLRERPLPPVSGRKRRYLLVADEWAPGKGGVSSFNVELARALRRAGRDVCVALPAISDEHVKEAAAAGIGLALPHTTVPGIDGPQNLLTGVRYVDNPSFRPDVIIGHGRFLGPYALALQSAAPTPPLRVHIVHTHPESLELAKEGQDGESRTGQAHERKHLEVDLAADADVVLGIGHKLWAWISDELNASGPAGRQIHEFVPGLRDWGQPHDPQQIPHMRTFLMTARADDYVSKGVLLAVQAVGEAKRARAQPQEQIRLVIRGVPEDHGLLRAQVERVKIDYGLEVIFRPYTDDVRQIRQDLYSSIAVLMPSLHVGFGLSAYEAIAAGIPVRISEESGLHDLLVALPSDGSRVRHREVLPVAGSNHVHQWTASLLDILDDPQEAYDRAMRLRTQIDGLNLWNSSIRALEEALDASRL